MLLRLNELYSSIQGEGPHVGEPTIFCRFSGCNMRCPAWPCDTQHAIQPSLWRDDPKLTPAEVMERIQDIALETGCKNVCITGGEPFVQDHALLAELVDLLKKSWFNIDIFTNGSFPFPEWVMNHWVTIVLDFKLSGSGEQQTKQEERLWNVTHRLAHKDVIKFTVTDMHDLEEALHLSRSLVTTAQYYVGRVWEKNITDAEIVQFILDNQLPWKFQMQVHKFIWPDKERGI